MTKWCGWFKFPDNVTLKAVSPACFLVSSSFLALPLLLWNSWPFPSISELSLSWFPQVSFLASWWWWGWYRVEEEARKPAQMLGPELDWVISQVPEVVKTKEPPESQRSKVKSQRTVLASRGWLPGGFSSSVTITSPSDQRGWGWRVWLFLTELCGDLGRRENCVCLCRAILQAGRNWLIWPKNKWLQPHLTTKVFLRACPGHLPMSGQPLESSSCGLGPIASTLQPSFMSQKWQG